MVSWGNVQPGRARAFPLADWTNKEVYEYLTEHDIKLTKDYEILGHSCQSRVYGESLQFLYEYYPDDYQKFLKDYPLCEAARLRFATTGH